MMIKKLLAVGLIALFPWINLCFGCSTFFMKKNGQMVFGRNYDWVTGSGMVNTNLRGLIKQSLTGGLEKTIRWTSQYGSITFNQFGKEFPNGGMNEKGLVVELMWLNESKYPAPDDRPGINVLQWIQYQLDNCASVAEVLATDDKIRLISTGTPQHYLIADAAGNAATVEFLNGKMVAHAGKDLPFPVLTNSTYEQSAAFVHEPQRNTNKEAPVADNSIDRFATACTMVQEYEAGNSTLSPVEQSFNILGKVAQGSFTKWSIVYDVTNRKIYFKTHDYQQIKSISMQEMGFTCNSGPVAFDMNRQVTGDITGSFSSFSAALNEKALLQAFSESRSQFTINENLIQAAVRYPVSVRCR